MRVVSFSDVSLCLNLAVLTFIFSLPLSQASTAEVSSTRSGGVNIDVSGEDGRPAIDGRCCGSDSRSRNPRKGEHATQGTDGENARNVVAHMEDNMEHDGYIVVYGNLYDLDRSGHPSNMDPFQAQLALNSTLFIDASGGSGQRGGYGGKGGPGAQGRSGSDAAAYKDGTNGGPGYAGAQGGNGTQGTNGGDGGRIVVSFPKSQSHLALMVQAEYNRGRRGEAGRNGAGGDGGPGGPGGRGGRFQEGTKQDCRSVYVPDTSSGGGSSYGGGSSFGGGGSRDLGNGYSTFDSFLLPLDDPAPPPLKQTEDNRALKFAGIAGDIFNELFFGLKPAYAGWERQCSDVPNYVRRSGGYRGSSGPDGPRGRGLTDPGQSGESGSFSFVLVDEETGEEVWYQRPFDLQLISYHLSDAAPGGNNDGIFEPGEEITVSNLVVKNTAKMPSPELADVILSFQTTEWILADPKQVKVPQLDGGESVQLDTTFKMKVKNSLSVGRGQSWSVSDTIVPRGSVPRIRKTVSGLRHEKTVSIAFPISMTSLQSVSSIGPGQTASFQWRIQNNSGGDFIGLNNAARSLRTTLRRSGGDAPQNTIEAFDFSTNHSGGNNNFLMEATSLKKGEAIIIRGEVHFSKKAEPYTYVDFSSTLGLEMLGSAEYNTIMTHGHRISIAQTYSYTPGASVLLLTHKDVERTEYESWLQLFADFNVEFDVWDISYQKGLNLAKDLTSSGQGRSLLKNYKGKTIIVLNSFSEDLRGKALRHLDQTQFYEAALSEGINFYVVGGKKDELARKIISMHLNPNGHRMSVQSAEDFFDQSNLDLTESAKIIQGEKNDFSSMAKKLRQQMDQAYSLVIAPNASGRPVPHLYPSLSAFNGQMVASPVNQRMMRTSGFINSTENIRPMLLSFSMEQKLITLDHFSRKEIRNEVWADLSSALIHDLVEASFIHATSASAQAQENALRPINAFKRYLQSLIHLETHTGMEHIGRVAAALKVFEQTSKDTDSLKQSTDRLLQQSETFKSSFEKYQRAFEEFQQARKKALPVDYDATFDTYKMFTLPASSRSHTGRELTIVRPISLGRNQ